MKKILSGILGIFAVFSFAVVAHAATTVVVTGNTSAGENQPGWMFNRDVSTSTPFEFNEDQHSIGQGSLYVLPIQNNNYSGTVDNNPNKDKFIAENFINAPIAEVNSISYDFMIGSGGDANDAEQFYMNVYANFGVSPDDKFYDCRYDVIPTVGSTGGFTTVTFDPTLNYPFAQSGSRPSGMDCPASPADMESISPGSNIRVFAINVGDTSVNDQGLDGYLDNVIVTTDTDVTTYDFEAFYPVSGEITNPATDGATVSGIVDFTATYDDGDEANDDGVQWAVRQGSCSTNTVFGNVDGRSDTYEWDGASFSATTDTSDWTPGEYCFVFNPVDDPGQDNVRLTRTFTVEEPVVGPPTSKDQCKNGGWREFNNPSFRNQGQCIKYVNGNNGNNSNTSNSTVRVNQRNTSTVSNNVTVTQNTGGNNANRNTGNTTVTTGNNSSIIEVITRAARNIFIFR